MAAGGRRAFARGLACLALGGVLASVPKTASAGNPREGEAPAQAPAAVVRLTDGNTFEPETVRIRVGESVRWENASGSTHTATDEPGSVGLQVTRLPAGATPFDSGYIGIGDGYTHRFTAPGTYRYICVLHRHQGMVGTIVVEPRG